MRWRSRDPGYLGWMLAQDFLDDAKVVVERALTAASDRGMIDARGYCHLS